MVIDRQIHGPGTSEPRWQSCDPLNTLPFASLSDLVPGSARLVVCAPHPDDEILPCGGLLAAAFDHGRTVKILAITDGEASHPGHSILNEAALRRARPEESKDALRRMGVDAAIRRLRIPDGGIEQHEADLTRAFLSEFQPGDVVVTPWRLDGHPDHEATARAVIKAAAHRRAVVLETPIWGWHWAKPENAPMPWHRGIRFAPDKTTQSRKRDAIQAFETQLRCSDCEPILSPATLARFTRPWEVYFR